MKTKNWFITWCFFSGPPFISEGADICIESNGVSVVKDVRYSFLQVNDPTDKERIASLEGKLDSLSDVVDSLDDPKKVVILPLSGRWAIQSNSMRGFVYGPYSDNHNSNYGNEAGFSGNGRVVSGWCYPDTVTIKRIYGWFRNNNAAANTWKLRVYRQVKTNNSTVSTNYILYDTVEFNFSDNNPHWIDIQLDLEVPSTDVFGVSLVRDGAQNPTRWLHVQGGGIQIEY